MVELGMSYNIKVVLSRVSTQYQTKLVVLSLLFKEVHQYSILNVEKFVFNFQVVTVEL